MTFKEQRLKDFREKFMGWVMLIEDNERTTEWNKEVEDFLAETIDQAYAQCEEEIIGQLFISGFNHGINRNDMTSILSQVKFNSLSTEARGKK